MDIIAVNAKLGDGCLHIPNGCKNARASFNGINIQWIVFKRDVAKTLYDVSPIRQSGSGYTKKKDQIAFTVNTDFRLTKAFNTSVSDVLKGLTKIDLIIWYLDDGSWHKTKKTIHLYCNMLTEEEVGILCDRIEFLYNIRPTPRQDRKKDGRSYPYLYFPRILTEKFKQDVGNFLVCNELDSFYYKIGETSETIRNGVGLSESEMGSVKLLTKI